MIDPKACAYSPATYGNRPGLQDDRVTVANLIRRGYPAIVHYNGEVNVYGMSAATDYLMRLAAGPTVVAAIFTRGT